jgi:Putative peptidoglycan binding domain
VNVLPGPMARLLRPRTSDQPPAGEVADGATSPNGRPGWRRRALAVAALCAAAILTAILALTLGGGGSQRSSASTRGPGTAKVERRDLTETATQSGTLGFSDTRAVVNRLGGTVTWLPGAGQTIRTGGRLYAVDGKPVILFNGKVPAYRSLASGVSAGPDVRELERNLVALGYDPSSAISVDDTFTSATASAVERWQRDVGLHVTGRVALGRIIFLPGNRRVSSTSATLGGSTSGGSSAGTGSATGSAASSTGTSVSGSETIFVDYSTTPADTTTTTTPSQTGSITGTDTTGQGNGKGSSGSGGKGSAGSKQGNGNGGNGKGGGGKGSGTKGGQSKNGSGQGTQTPTASQGTSGSSSTGSASSTGGASSSSGSGSGQSSQQSSSAGATANTIMETTSDRQVVSVDLDASKQTLARVGDRVSVQLPNSSFVNGRISRVSKVAQTSTSSTSSSTGSSTTTIPVTIKLTSSKGVTSLDQAPVTVQFAQSQRKGVLAIPVTALLAEPGGKYAVEVIKGQRRYRITVTPGLYAGGYVEISGAGLQSGMTVSNATL